MKLQQQSMKHINEVSRNGKPGLKLQNSLIHPFHAVRLQQELRLCVALPDVHEALRQNDPRMVSHSQPVVKKAPPSSGRPMPSIFHSDAEPPRIGALVQPPPPAARPPVATQGMDLLLAATPMTPSHPPRPPLEALPKYPSMETSSSANKHPLDPSTAQGPPSKHVLSKAFPYSSQPPDQVYVAASATVDMPQASSPCPKGPPAEYMPTPPEITSMPTSTERAKISHE